MIDFSTLKGLTIPEGVVTQIADASGRVLWSAVKNVTVTINEPDKYCYFQFDNEANLGNQLASGTYEVPEGTVLHCLIYPHSGSDDLEDCRSSIYVNGVEMAGEKLRGDEKLRYQYTITKNTTVYSTFDSSNGSDIYITEIRNDPATVRLRVNSTSNSEAKGKEVYFQVNADVEPMPDFAPGYIVNPYTLDGSSDRTQTIKVPAGTIIKCVSKDGSVKLNGVNVSTSYDYIVTGDASLYMRVQYNYAKGTYADITITET